MNFSGIDPNLIGRSQSPAFFVTKPTPDRYPPKIAVAAVRLLAYLISKPLWFVRFVGKENIPPESAGGIIIASNHQTYIDPVWICIPLSRRVRYLAIEKAFHWPVIGAVIKYLGAFPVKQTDGLSVSTIKVALRSLREGAAVIIFPEGEREFADGKLLPFKQGAARLAVQAGVGILPVTVSGGDRIWPQGQKYPNLFRRAVITYHPMIKIATGSESKSDEVIDHLTTALETAISRDTN